MNKRGKKLWRFFGSKEGRAKVAKTMSKPFDNICDEEGFRPEFRGEKSLWMRRVDHDVVLRLQIGQKVYADPKGYLIPGEEILFGEGGNLVKTVYNSLKNWDNDSVHIHIFVRKHPANGPEAAGFNPEYDISVFLSNKPFFVEDEHEIKKFPLKINKKRRIKVDESVCKEGAIPDFRYKGPSKVTKSNSNKYISPAKYGFTSSPSSSTKKPVTSSSFGSVSNWTLPSINSTDLKKPSSIKKICGKDNNKHYFRIEYHIKSVNLNNVHLSPENLKKAINKYNRIKDFSGLISEEASNTKEELDNLCESIKADTKSRKNPENKIKLASYNKFKS